MQDFTSSDMTGKKSGSCHSAVGAGFEGMNLTKPLRGLAPAGGIASRGGLPGRTSARMRGATH